MQSVRPLTMLLALITPASLFGGRDVVVGTEAPENRLVSLDDVSHEAWDTLLQNYVDDAGRVDYSRWKDNRNDLALLDRYLSQLSTGSPGKAASPEGKLAFWINAYNALTIKGILREYPTDSIRNHTSKLGGYNIWKDLKLYVAAETYSLDEIEHDILRKLGEPRIHFAIVCASLSCPRLIAEAYVGSRLDEQLALNTRHFFASPVGFRHDPTTRRFYVSKILDWFADDFGPNQATRLRTIAPYLPDQAAREAARANSVKLSYLKYDWSLNDQATVRP